MLEHLDSKLALMEAEGELRRARAEKQLREWGLLKEECPEGALFKGVLPFVLADVVRVALLVAFPAISLWLPSKMITR